MALFFKYYLLFMIFSFGGWLWEVIFCYVLDGKFFNRGFMRLPFCPIYGSCILMVFFLLGTPHEPGGILKKVHGPVFRYFWYGFFAFTVPTLVELGVGIFFDKVLGICEWSYASLPLNLNGYVCVPVSLAWAAALTLIMRFLFPPIQNVVFRIPDKAAQFVSVPLLCTMIIDLTGSFLAL